MLFKYEAAALVVAVAVIAILQIKEAYGWML